ncbi:NAD(P)-binding protein [Trematosphaeria pertusa]|uniref:NAD(P)-binding protein n=1 Tax=Trematosphaeria pertusa TaxID=390896 RepID=A0A6A6J1Q2_9PLEO|nr:NAD(P)-binding protein [Trematosphaeria pertusa]KAF2256488.1 NAD(P)-binding protein [Trematosphaeria pertusa]
MTTLALQPFATKAILVTGAAQGIGLAIARYLARRGANLALADRKKAELESASAAIAKENPDVKIMSRAVDVSNTHEVNAFVADTVRTFGKLNGAVNNAGILGKWGNIEDIKDEDWQRVQQINLGGVMRCLRAELGVIEEGGSIVNMSSVAGLIGFPGLSPYVCSKHAVIGLTKCAAKEAGARNVRVNAVCPGPIVTPMLDEVYHGTTLPTPPIARDGQPEEIASVVGYLLGDESKYTSGVCIPVDGAGYAC